MNLVSISTDKNILKPDSQVALRQVEYAKVFHSMHIIVFSKLTNIKKLELSSNCFVYPTNSKSKFFYIFDAVKIARNIKFEKITTQDPFETGLVGLFIKKKTGKPLEIQVHTDLFSHFFYKGGVLNVIRKLIAKITLLKADHIRVVATRIKESLIEEFGSRLKSEIEVRPVFVDLEKVRQSRVDFDLRREYPQFRKHIIMVGRLEKEKNYPLAIESFKKVLDTRNDIGFIIVGNGSFVIPEDSNIISLGYRSDVYSCMKTADLLLHTSWYEGYGMVFKEAEACGLAIVSTDVGIAQEVGATIVPRNPDLIAIAILEKVK